MLITYCPSEQGVFQRGLQDILGTTIGRMNKQTPEGSYEVLLVRGLEKSSSNLGQNERFMTLATCAQFKYARGKDIRSSSVGRRPYTKLFLSVIHE